MTAIEQILDRWANQQKSELIDKYKSMGLKASGKFERETFVNPKANGTQILVPPHTGIMVTGRTPNKKQSQEDLKKWVGWAGNTFLKKWVADKGLNISPFAVAWKIAKEGVKVPNNYNDGTLIKSVLTQSKFDSLRSEIGFIFLLDIKTEIQKTWQ